ncbi:ankyrin repeat protein [Oesophagostomum dentatum]|uniref:Ankyrin repeat protein n=1 Tax=Oesophagostomum dentatum TaxID=61180 RepID=A0A0B1SLG0_OESDE|nr:ankyrin repeat protein [Oesophagostomum dentatum]
MPVKEITEEVVRELLSLGAPVEQQSLNGQSALRVAALSGNAKIVRVLAEHITDWEQQDMEGTPLVHTLLINKQVSAINDMCGARMLRRLAASFEAVDSGGRTPLLTAVWNGHIEMAAYLLETVGVNPNSVDEQGASALSVAAQLGNRDMVVLLLRMGAEPSLKDLDGRTALDVATMYGHETIRAVLQVRRVMKYNIRLALELSQISNYGKSTKPGTYSCTSCSEFAMAARLLREFEKVRLRLVCPSLNVYHGRS